MNAITHTQGMLASVGWIARPDSHQACMVCGAGEALGLQFQSDGKGVIANFAASLAWQGYRGVLHGGMISTLLDAAMTHCLFQQGIEAMTADLQVRFIKPVPCQAQLCLRAMLLQKKRKIYQLSAELCCEAIVLAHAQASFMKRKET